MIDTYLYEMEKRKNKYISEHKDKAAFNLKKYFNPRSFKESDFETFPPIFPIKEVKKMTENRINSYCDSFGVKWSLKDTFSEMENLKNSGNAFLMYTADFCTLAADILVNEKEYNYSEAFFGNVRCAELLHFMRLQDIFDVQVTLCILTTLWCAYVGHHIEEDFTK